jgi:hypothetical protein
MGDDLKAYMPKLFADERRIEQLEQQLAAANTRICSYEWFGERIIKQIPSAEDVSQLAEILFWFYPPVAVRPELFNDLLKELEKKNARIAELEKLLADERKAYADRAGKLIRRNGQLMHALERGSEPPAPRPVPAPRVNFPLGSIVIVDAAPKAGASDLVDLSLRCTCGFVWEKDGVPFKCPACGSIASFKRGSG